MAILHVDVGHQPLTQRAAKRTPCVLHALGTKETSKVFPPCELIGTLDPRLAYDRREEDLELGERDLKVLIRLASVRRRTRVVLPKVVDCERCEPVRDLLVDALLV